MQFEWDDLKIVIEILMENFFLDSSQDEEEEVKAVTVKFARQETAEQKSRRIKSYDYLKRKQSEETWVHCTYSKSQVSSSN